MNQSSQTPAVSGNRTQGLQEPSPRPMEDIISYLRTYAREKPDVAALWCFGIGFVLGWKLKPW